MAGPRFTLYSASMDKVPDRKKTSQYLYPPADPFDQRMMDVGDGHRIYVEQCGNPDGIPVVVLHGGPGGGCSPAMRRYFDPLVYRVILEWSTVCVLWKDGMRLPWWCVRIKNFQS